MKIIKRYKILYSLIAVSILFCAPLMQAYTASFVEHVANTYLSTFKTVNTQNIEKAKQKSLNQQDFMDHLKAIMAVRELGLREVDERSKIEIEFKHASQLPQGGDVINSDFLHKMELVRNLNEETVTDHLMHYLTTGNNNQSYLATAIGHKRFAELIAQPLVDESVICKRQAVIEELVNNNNLRTKCIRLLRKIKEVEPLVYDLYLTSEIIDIEKTLYCGPVLDKLGFNQPFPLDVTTRFAQAMQLFGVATPFITAAAGYALSKKVTNKESAGKLYFGVGYIGVCSSFLSFLNLSIMKQQANATLNIQERLIGVSTYINSIKKLVRIIDSNPSIQAAMPVLKEMYQQLHDNEEKSEEFNELNHLLTKSTFEEGKPSYFSSPGNILRAYRHFIKTSVKFEYGEVKNLLGEIDVYVALAQKIKELQHTDTPFCFVNFVQNNKPIMQAYDFWNPFINPKKVVCNSISLNMGDEHNIILTGPNTGGKSTMMKAIMLNALLAQTFGIATARTMNMTLFTKLMAYLNVADDTASGISLFKAETKRAQELMEMMRSLKKNEFALIIIDEIFTGTAPDKAEELSYKFISKLSEFDNCIFVDATHFKKLVELEKITNGICKNYHTGVIINPDQPDKVEKYTYKLVPGPSPINNAQQVAEEAGVFSF